MKPEDYVNELTKTLPGAATQGDWRILYALAEIVITNREIVALLKNKSK